MSISGERQGLGWSGEHDRDGARDGAPRRSRAEDLLDLYFDRELDERGRAELRLELETDPSLRRQWERTRGALMRLQAGPMVRDRTEAILARAGEFRRFESRSARFRIWGCRSAIAAGFGLTLGALMWLDRTHPEMVHEADPAPLGALETASRQDAATVPEAMKLAGRTIKDATSPTVLAFSPGDPTAGTVWTLSTRADSSSGGERAVMSVAEFHRGSSRAVPPHAAHHGPQALATAFALPDLSVLRCDWSPDSTARYLEDDALMQRSWWMRSWASGAAVRVPASYTGSTERGR